MGAVRIGTAGWAIPRDVADAFPAVGSALQRYATRFTTVEINSSFHRSHRPGTWARWADSVPPDFRLAVKLPKTITHQRKLVECEEPLRAFADEVSGLGSRRGPLLVQLPPSLAFDAAVAAPFFAELARLLPGDIACEPRHPSWFEPAADALLRDLGVARVAADPAPCGGADEPGGWPGLCYVRLHGSPRTYWSAYPDEVLQQWATRARNAAANGAAPWVMFDNTAGGAALGDALRLQRIVGGY